MPEFWAPNEIGIEISFTILFAFALRNCPVELNLSIVVRVNFGVLMKIVFVEKFNNTHSFRFLI